MPFTTRILPVPDAGQNSRAIAYAASILRGGGLVAIPTETVYGLAANGLDPGAVANIFKVKGRPPDNPLILHISSYEQLSSLTVKVTQKAHMLARSFWPGPLTIVLPRSGIVPDIVTAGLDTVAVRMPSHPVALAVIAAVGVPVAAPSANISGRPSPTTAAHCARDLDGLIELILDGGPCSVGVESTVLTLATPAPRLLRPGAITLRQIQDVIGEPVEVDRAVLEHAEEGAAVASPGMKYTHYSPRAKVVILGGEWEECRKLLASRQDEGAWGLVFEEELAGCPIPALSLGSRHDVYTQARRLFAALRELDEKGAVVIYARAPKDEGMGLAVYNRLIRAAGFSILKL